MNLSTWPKSDAEPDWDDDDPIILEQPPTWLYWNVKGQIVIGQQQCGFENEMPFVFFSVASVPALISALREKLAELAAADSEQFERKPAKQLLTGTERQRRYKKRSSGVTRQVTKIPAEVKKLLHPVTSLVTGSRHCSRHRLADEQWQRKGRITARRESATFRQGRHGFPIRRNCWLPMPGGGCRGRRS